MPDGPAGEVRSYWVCLALAVFTAGLYGVWYHWATHRELCRWMGRDVKEKPLLVAATGLFFGFLLMTGLFVSIVEGFPLAGMADAVRGASRLIVSAGIVILVLTMVGGVGCLVVYVGQQLQVIAQAKKKLDLPYSNKGLVAVGYVVFVVFGISLLLERVAAGFAAGFVERLLAAVIVAAFPVTYWFLHKNYTEIWKHVRSMQRPQTSGAAPSTGAY